MINPGRRGVKAVDRRTVGAAVALLVLMVTVVGCTSEAPVTSPPSETATAAPTYAPLPTYTPYPTYTPVPTATPVPAPTPTATPEPTATSAPPRTLTPADMDRAALIALYGAAGSASRWIGFSLGAAANPCPPEPQSGLNIGAVSARLGHGRPTVTLKTYLVLVPDTLSPNPP